MAISCSNLNIVSPRPLSPVSATAKVAGVQLHHIACHSSLAPETTLGAKKMISLSLAKTAMTTNQEERMKCSASESLVTLHLLL
jgi:hypothetical protein